MRGFRRGFGLLSTVLLLSFAVSAQEAPPEGEAPDGRAREERLAQRDRLIEQGRALEQDGKVAEAVRALEAVLAIEREIYGEDHEEVAGSLAWIAGLQERRGDFAAARARLEESLAVHGRLHEAGHWKITDARRELQDLGLREALEPEQRGLLAEAGAIGRRLAATVGASREDLEAATRALRIRRDLLGEDHPSTARSLGNLASIHRTLGEFAAAEPLYRRALEIKGKTLGENHPSTVKSLHGLATFYISMGRYAAAEPLCLRALAISRRLLGEAHSDHANYLNTLARLYELTGRLADAEPLYRQVLEVWGRTVGEEHPVYALGLDNLAGLYESLGRFAAAEPLFRQALLIRGKALGEDHPLCATTLNNLAMLYNSMGDQEAAEPLLRRALEIVRKSFGEEHPDFAKSLNNLALLHLNTGDAAAAEPLFLQALEIQKRVHGEEHPDYAMTLENLATLRFSTGELAAAEHLYGRTLEIRKKALGTDHPDTARSLSNLAALYDAMGEHERAEPLCRQALGIKRKILGEHHPDYATSLNNLAMLCEATGRSAEAAGLLREAIEIDRRLLDATFAVQSEREQFRASRGYRVTLDAYLSLSARAGVTADDAYALVLPWKGAIFARQVRARIPRRDSSVARLFEKLEVVNRRLATLYLSVPPPDRREANRRRILELSKTKEELERELSRQSQAYREARAAEWLTPRELQEALPSGVLLLDFLEYRRAVPAEEDGGESLRPERHLLAFLVPAEGEIRRLDLGPAAAVTKAVEEWRASIPRKSDAKAGADLRRLVWWPLEKHLSGAQTILVSPDGALNRLPFAALPGGRPGTYLVEEVSVAVIPVPQLLPGLLARAPARAGEESLLLLGDVDYGGDPGDAGSPLASRSAAGTARGPLPRFGRIDATRAEVLAVRDSFERSHEEGRVELLRRRGATEEAFCVAAPRHRWLHMATHGFFAPPALVSALTDAGGSPFGDPDVRGHHPGLLSGLALSGANTPPEADGDDGILTALEVAALDLSAVEVAVLSACETGLGEVAGGEGVLGLQRAFQVAGAKTTVTSLWKVPDAATLLLMQEFYENLWGRGLPILDALREAQLRLMREGRTRGLGLESEGGERLPPYYWAGFVLSGDWR